MSFPSGLGSASILASVCPRGHSCRERVLTSLGPHSQGGTLRSAVLGWQMLWNGTLSLGFVALQGTREAPETVETLVCIFWGGLYWVLQRVHKSYPSKVKNLFSLQGT